MDGLRKRGPSFVRHAKLGKRDLSLYSQCDTRATDNSVQDPMRLIENAAGYGHLIEGYDERVRHDGHFR